MRWFTGIVCVFAIAGLGVVSGALLITRLMRMSDMGVDQISTMLMGIMGGGMLGTIAGAAAALKFSSRTHLVLTAIAVVASVALVLLFRTTPVRVG